MAGSIQCAADRPGRGAHRVTSGSDYQSISGGGPSRSLARMAPAVMMKRPIVWFSIVTIFYSAAAEACDTSAECLSM